MTETYESILKRMKDKYEETSGNKAEDTSDIAIRLEVLAGEIYALLTELSWLRRQAFPQSALGKELDMHAEQRGQKRHSAKKAQGELTFLRQNPLSYDVSIPKGTICAVSGDEITEYETIDSAVLSSGDTEISVKASAVVGGEKGNASVGYINTLVTPPAGIETVTNKIPFTGGMEEEEDLALRHRLIESYSVLSNGMNAEFYRRAALADDRVGTAVAVPRESGIGTVSVYIWGKENEPSEALLAETQERINKLREVNVDVTVKPAKIKTIDVFVYVKTKEGTTPEQSREKCEGLIKDYFLGKGIGDAVYKNEIGAVLMRSNVIENYQMAANMQDVERENGKIPVLGRISLMEKPL